VTLACVDRDSHQSRLGLTYWSIERFLKNFSLRISLRDSERFILQEFPPASLRKPTYKIQEELLDVGPSAEAPAHSMA